MGNFFSEKKSRNAEKNWKGGPFGLVRHCMLCGKLFGSVPCAHRWNLKFCRTFGRTILVSSGGLKKTPTKSHDYSRLFSLEKRWLKKHVQYLDNLHCWPEKTVKSCQKRHCCMRTKSVTGIPDYKTIRNGLSQYSLKVQNQQSVLNMRNPILTKMLKPNFWTKCGLFRKKNVPVPKTQNRPSEIAKGFSRQKLSSKLKAVPFDHIKIFSKKSRTVPKKPWVFSTGIEKTLINSTGPKNNQMLPLRLGQLISLKETSKKLRIFLKFFLRKMSSINLQGLQ